MTLSITAEPVPLRLDADGAVRVGGTRVTLDTVVEGFHLIREEVRSPAGQAPHRRPSPHGTGTARAASSGGGRSGGKVDARPPEGRGHVRAAA